MAYKRITLYIIAAILITQSSAISQDRETLRWERSKPKITRITVEGNQYFSDGTIRKQMYSKTYGFWSSLRRDRQIYVQRETLGRDTLEIKYLYLKNGFLDVTVNEEFALNGRDSSAIVHVKINEGRQYFYGAKIVTGNHDFTFNSNFDKIAGQLKTGKAFDVFLVRAAVFDMKTLLANEGYPYANVDYSIDSPGPTEFDDIVFMVSSDSLVRFGEVSITGNNNFPEYTARRELKIINGNIYRRKDIIESQTRLLESGYFTTVRFDQDNNSESRLNPDFTLNLRERKSRFITITTGAGQSENKDLVWNLSGRFGKRNFLGSRRYELLSNYAFTLGKESALIEHRYRVRFTEPWFIGIRMPMILTGEIQPRIKDPNRNFFRESWAASIETNRRFGLKVRSTLGAEYEFVRISGVPVDEIETLKKEEGNSARRKIYGALRSDSRNDLFVPQRGILIDFSSEYFGGFLGGDENFVKLQASWSTYQAIKKDFVSATRLRGGWAKAFAESQTVPIDEALFLGGANSVRGYAEKSLGPVDSLGNVEGGTYTIVFNQEFRWKTVQVLTYVPLLRGLFKSIPLWQSVFFDAGNGFRHLNEVKAGTMAYGYGTGFQFISPAGPIRIDYARRIPTDRYSVDSRWHFTILYAF